MKKLWQHFWSDPIFTGIGLMLAYFRLYNYYIPFDWLELEDWGIFLFELILWSTLIGANCTKSLKDLLIWAKENVFSKS